MSTSELAELARFLDEGIPVLESRVDRLRDLPSPADADDRTAASALLDGLADQVDALDDLRDLAAAGDVPGTVAALDDERFVGTAELAHELGLGGCGAEARD